jgi:hypothetical protein
MSKFLNLVLCGLLLACLSKAEAQVNAATCNSSDVQTAINNATEGQTVSIPKGTCTWSSGVTISGKGIIVQGAGSGRIVAYDNGTEVLSVGTGSKSVTIAGFSPGMTGSVFVAGQTVTLTALGFESNYSMTGTVTSYSGNTLTINVTSTTGSGSTHRWFVSTPSSTVLINNSSTAMFAVTEDSGFDTQLSGFKIQAGSGAGDGVDFNYNASGKAIVLENCWIQQGSGDSVHTITDRGVVSQCSFDSPTFSMAPIAIHMKIATPAAGQNAWLLPSYWGSSDTTGQNNFYVETSDFEAYLNATDDDDNGRFVFRYNLMNNAGFGTHGADTSPYGQRYFEYYNNTGVFNGYSDGSTFNLNWWVFVRGGSYVVHDNNLTTLTSTDYGTKADVLMIVMNLQRNAGPNPCWGANYSTPGQYYHAPRQVGYGRVTGTGTANFPTDKVSAATTDSVTYVGDSEPAYIWNNSVSPLPNIETEDYGAGNTDSCSGGTLDSTKNYAVLNRDYFNGSTAKPSYAPYTYPHPLAGTSTQKSGPLPPVNVKAVAN